MNRSAIDLWVGIFVAIGFGAVLFLALKVGNLLTLDRTPGYHLDANFDNIGGLKLRAPVKAAGVVVGRVESVRLDTKTYDAVVTMRIDHQYEFTKDTIAAINTSGLLGEVYIGLDAGGDPVMLKDGDRIRKTQSAVVIEKLIGQFLFDKASGGAGGEAAPVKTVEKPAGETKK
jgi:phospholipid/cholesterol/gamma-HCH transport system substrate-binding protein